jgi:hypothetical protein
MAQPKFGPSSTIIVLEKEKKIIKINIQNKIYPTYLNIQFVPTFWLQTGQQVPLKRCTETVS